MLVDEALYHPRILDEIVERHLEAFGAVEISGTMWSGKTWTALAHANSCVSFDDKQTRDLAEFSMDAVLNGEAPSVIDEWQEVPAVWNAVRRKVDDAGGRRGLYILTGSSRPPKDTSRHSGAGRISRIRMWPMSLAESDDSGKTVSLSALFEGKFENGKVETDVDRLAELICRGGWPGALNIDSAHAGLIPEQYIDAIVTANDKNAPESGDDLRLFLRSLARNIGSAVTIDTLTKDMGYLTEGKVTESGRSRIRKLLSYFTDRFVVDPLRGWDAPIKSPSRLRSKPRYNFADPSLGAALLGVEPETLKKNMQLFGQLFEELCLRDLHVYASALKDASPNALHYYRDADGLEVDVIIELRDGRWGAIEIKLGVNKVDEAVRNLLRLKRKVASNPAARNPEPSFLLVLVGRTKYKYKTPDGVIIAPITELTV